MKILSIKSRPIDRIAHLTAPAGGGPPKLNTLDMVAGQVDHLPPGLDGILLTGDLQGRELRGQDRLLGEVLASRLPLLARQGKIPEPSRLGVILAGDFYAKPGNQKRGGLGDVTEVWQVFFDQVRWVAGVLGNHDLVALPKGSEAMAAGLLDGTCLVRDTLKIGGVSGIIGDPKRSNRKKEDDFVLAILTALEDEPDVLVLHQGPELPGGEHPGHPAVTEALADARNLLVVCGHVPWENSLAAFHGRPNVQVLNVDARAILLTKAHETITQERPL